MADPAATPRLASRVFRLLRYTQRWCFLCCKKCFICSFVVLSRGSAVLHSRGTALVSHPPGGATFVPVCRGDSSTRLLLWERGDLPLLESTQGWLRGDMRCVLGGFALLGLLLTCSCSQQSSAPSLPLPWAFGQIPSLLLLWHQRESWAWPEESKAVAGSASR